MTPARPLTTLPTLLLVCLSLRQVVCFTAQTAFLTRDASALALATATVKSRTHSRILPSDHQNSFPSKQQKQARRRWTVLQSKESYSTPQDHRQLQQLQQQQQQRSFGLLPKTLSPQEMSTIANDAIRNGLQKRTLPKIQPMQRQKLFLNAYPLLITLQDNPVRNWVLNALAGESSVEAPPPTRLYANGTLIEESMASLDTMPSVPQRQALFQKNELWTLELIDEVRMDNPGYVHVLPSNTAGASADRTDSTDSDRVWVTGFTLTGNDGLIHSVDSQSARVRSVSSKTSRSILWPNESNFVPKTLYGPEPSAVDTEAPQQQPPQYDDALLVSDGFLVPGKDRGGLYLVKNPSDPINEQSICLTGGRYRHQRKNVDGGCSNDDDDDDDKHNWFYHRSVWVDLTGDGRKSILTARARVRNPFQYTHDGRAADTQLVWLEMPKPHHYDEQTNAPLEEDGTPFDPFAKRHLPWKTHVLGEGPDVMFTVADLDTEDDTIEVISSEFFERKVGLRSIQKGPIPKVVFSRIIDEECGAPFSAILADLDVQPIDSTKNRVVDSGSTVMTSKPGDGFSHLVVTSQYYTTNDQKEVRKSPFLSINDSPRNGLDDLSYNPAKWSKNGGSLFAYRVPQDWKKDSWQRSTIASGFTVREKLHNMINPGAPGFVYTFYAQKNAQDGKNNKRQRPMIAVAGDCSESAYLLRPFEDNDNSQHPDPSTRYRLLCEIETGATVGSIGIGYHSFNGKADNDFAKIYLPLFEKNKMAVFALGDGSEDEPPNQPQEQQDDLDVSALLHRHRSLVDLVDVNSKSNILV